MGGEKQQVRGHLLVLCFAGKTQKTARVDGLVIGGLAVPEAVGGTVDMLTGGKGVERVTLVSLGAEKTCNAEEVRRAGGAMAGCLSRVKSSRAVVDFSLLGSFADDACVGAVCEGLSLGSFRFDRHKTRAEKVPACAVTLRGLKKSAAMTAAVKCARVVSDGTNLARELGHEPANVINPVTLANRVKAIAKRNGLTCRVLDEKQQARLKMGAMLAVGQAGSTPSRLIVLEHNLSAGGKPVVLIGKAITFDTGGYSLKDKTNIVGMKYDKCGGMAVIGAMQAIAALKLKVPVVGVIAAAENMISDKAYRPNDIIKAMNGKTIEIISTDAEGRLVLADALCYAQKVYKPRCMVDLATLTGGVVVALGHLRGGIFANDDKLADRLKFAGDRTYERLWSLPMDDDYFELLKSDDCDMKNSAGRVAHATLGAVFLKQFVDPKVAWAHLDIAGVATTEKELPYCPRGGTGFGVRLLVDYLERLT